MLPLEGQNTVKSIYTDRISDFEELPEAKHITSHERSTKDRIIVNYRIMDCGNGGQNMFPSLFEPEICINLTAFFHLTSDKIMSYVALNSPAPITGRFCSEGLSLLTKWQPGAWGHKRKSDKRRLALWHKEQ